jgi:hypothetical protein
MRVSAKLIVGLVSAALTAATVSCGDNGSATSAGSASCGTKEIPVQMPEAAASRPTLPANEDGLVAAVADSFCATFIYKLPDGGTLTRPAVLTSNTEASCIATTLIQELGTDRVRQLGLGLSAWSLLGFGLANHRSIQRPEAETIVNTFEKCSKNWELLMIKSATEGTDKISDSSAQCTSQQLADSDARVILVGEIDRAYDEDPTAVPFFEAVKPLITAMEKCLKPDELAGLDWN